MPKHSPDSYNPWRYTLAPMMDYSDRHCRTLWRLITKHARLYSEMVVTGAIIHGDRERFLNFNHEEHPVALQLGGSDPNELARCAKIAQDWGYDEVNLNCGCPSDRVQKGRIGAILMSEPDLVAQCVKSMQDACTIPITVKNRIGIDDQDDYSALSEFVYTVSEAGCSEFIVHARKAWLSGLSPKENRHIPPLRYELISQLKRDFPHLTICVNGGIKTTDEALKHLNDLDGVMIGREAYSNPWSITDVDEKIFACAPFIQSRHDILTQYAHYCEQEVAKGTYIHHMSKHVLGLFSGQPGGRLFRREMSELLAQKKLNTSSMLKAAELVSL
ncbi:MAG: tRNA-dihydrouridine synthase A [Flavobacteriales bacterium]|jgi:tRNA-dihydrouridine synthase A